MNKSLLFLFLTSFGLVGILPAQDVKEGPLPQISTVSKIKGYGSGVCKIGIALLLAYKSNHILRALLGAESQLEFLEKNSDNCEFSIAGEGLFNYSQVMKRKSVGLHRFNFKEFCHFQLNLRGSYFGTVVYQLDHQAAPALTIHLGGAPPQPKVNYLRADRFFAGSVLAASLYLLGSGMVDIYRTWRQSSDHTASE